MINATSSIVALRAIAVFLTVCTIADAAEIPVRLSGEVEVPRVSSSAKGLGTIHVGDDGSLSGTITTTGLEGISAQVHDGSDGERGPVVVSLTKSGNAWSIPAGTRLTLEQLNSLKAGKLYINVHSKAHMDGEIRGRLIYPASGKK